MANIVDSVKGRFHRELVANPLTHGWVLNLYRSGERYPQRVCDYFQSDFAPTQELAVLLQVFMRRLLSRGGLADDRLLGSCTTTRWLGVAHAQ